MKYLPERRNLNSGRATYSYRKCEAVSVAIWYLLHIYLSTEGLELVFMSFAAILSLRFLVVHADERLT
jgi:hypothetical protein